MGFFGGKKEISSQKWDSGLLCFDVEDELQIQLNCDKWGEEIIQRVLGIWRRVEQGKLVGGFKIWLERSMLVAYHAPES